MKINWLRFLRGDRPHLISDKPVKKPRIYGGHSRKKLPRAVKPLQYTRWTPRMVQTKDGSIPL